MYHAAYTLGSHELLEHVWRVYLSIALLHMVESVAVATRSRS